MVKAGLRVVRGALAGLIFGGLLGLGVGVLIAYPTHAVDDMSGWVIWLTLPGGAIVGAAVGVYRAFVALWVEQHRRRQT